MPTRSYYVVAPPPARSRWERWWLWLRTRRGANLLAVGDGKNYTGWTAKAMTDRDAPAGTRGRVVAAWVRSGELVHAVKFPDRTVHAPLPWPDFELIPPGEDSVAPASSGGG
ncbi:MAG: hypothetical protein ACRDTC_09390 [Pseudonocardiaceae bacterium]